MEAYHAGVIRALLIDLVNAGTDTPFGPVSTVVELISDLRDSVDGPSDLDQGVVTGTYGDEANYVPTDTSGLVFARTVDQILPIVYLGGETMGGFFPEGVVTAMPAPAACSGICEYRVTVNMEWSPESHPVDFPMEPMGFFPPFYTVTHDDTCVHPPVPFARIHPGGFPTSGVGVTLTVAVQRAGSSCGARARHPHPASSRLPRLAMVTSSWRRWRRAAIRAATRWRSSAPR